jgi:8-oxo-dGTP diphosphatase
MYEKPYVLSVKVVIRDKRGRCLLLKRAKSSKNNPGKWDFPGGKVDPGESFHEALLREVKEETGLLVSLKRVIGAFDSNSKNRKVKVAYIFLEGRTKSHVVKELTDHDEHIASEWVERSELKEWKPKLCPQFRQFACDYGSIE